MPVSLTQDVPQTLFENPAQRHDDDDRVPSNGVGRNSDPDGTEPPASPSHPRHFQGLMPLHLNLWFPQMLCTSGPAAAGEKAMDGDLAFSIHLTG